MLQRETQPPPAGGNGFKMARLGRLIELDDHVDRSIRVDGKVCEIRRDLAAAGGCGSRACYKHDRQQQPAERELAPAAAVRAAGVGFASHGLAPALGITYLSEPRPFSLRSPTLLKQRLSPQA